MTCYRLPGNKEQSTMGAPLWGAWPALLNVTRLHIVSETAVET